MNFNRELKIILVENKFNKLLHGFSNVFSYLSISQCDDEMECSQFGICFISKEFTQEIAYFHF